jgi:ADP-heptose:LPS heptosyltransferase
MKNIVVLRLSSMGDVLLTLPVIHGVLSLNPDLQIIFVTRKRFVPYFSEIDRLIAIPFDPSGKHQGFPGLWKLFREIRHYRFSKVVDLHGIIRTWYLDSLFLLTGSRVYRINKHRNLRSKILKDNSLNVSVPHATDRYLDVFLKAGFKGEISKVAFVSLPDIPESKKPINGVVRIGIAPISKHRPKNWALNYVADLIGLLQQRYSAEIHLFGGLDDQWTLNSLSGTNIFNHAGVLDPLDEVSFIKTLDVFVSMDSANMHLASLVGVPVVSIWGATDPKLGFAPLYQPDGNALYADPSQVECRPCSVFGEIPCQRTKAPMICMKSIRPEQVSNKISEILHLPE